MVQSSNVMDKMVKSYSDHSYRHPTTVLHDGTVIAFAMSQTRQIFYAVLDLSDEEASAVDVDAWPENPRPIFFPAEVEQVGLNITGAIPLPVVKKGGRVEAKITESLDVHEINPFLSTSARFTADVPFRVYSDNRHVYIFRQAIDDSHQDTIFRLSNGLASGDLSISDDELIHDKNGNKIPLVNATLLCDRFVLSKDTLIPTREARYRRSKLRSKPASQSDVLGATDMEGNPFYSPTLELNFISHLKNGCFDVVQLPTAVSTLKRWQFFAYNSTTDKMDCVNLEVADDGLFNCAGTQLFTSPDPRYRKSVLERKPGKCPFTKKSLVPKVNLAGLAESSVTFSKPGDFVQGTIEPWYPDAFTLEFWMKSSSDSPGAGDAIFASADGAKDGSFQIVYEGSKICLKHSSVVLKFDIITSVWQHLAVVYDGKNLQCIAGGRETECKEVPDLKIYFDSYIFGTGCDKKTTLSGQVDEVRLWEFARSTENIRRSRNSRLSGNELGLRGYWRFDEGSGKVSCDQTINLVALQLHGGCSWTASNCPIGDNNGIRRSSFSIADRTVGKGVCARLFYQQEKTVGGYGSEMKPMKSQARVMIALVATHSAGSHIAAVDAAISREGKMAQLPDILSLPSLNKPESSGDVSIISQSEKKLRVIGEEIISLEQEVKRCQAASDSKEAKDLEILKEQLAEAKLKEEERIDIGEDFEGHLLYRGNQDTCVGGYGWPDGPAMLGMAEDIGPVQFYAVAKGCFHMETDSGMIMVEPERGSKPVLWISWNNYPGDAWTLIPIGDGKFLMKSEIYDQYVGVHNERWLVLLDEKDPREFFTFRDRVFSKNFLNSTARDVGRLEEEVAKMEVIVEERKKATEKLEQLSQSLATKKIEREELEQKVGELSGGTLAPLTVPMKQIYIDSSGLSVSGGILMFATSCVAPHILDCATGQLALYFLSVDRSLMATYFDTNVERTKFVFPDNKTNLTFSSRGGGGVLNSCTLQVSTSSSYEACKITLHDADSDIYEEWDGIPRKADEFVGIFNGTVPRPSSVTATAQPSIVNVSKSSAYLVAKATFDGGEIQDAEATVVPGRSNRWLADAPGRAYFFEKGSSILYLPEEQLESSATEDMFTLEAWVYPSQQLEGIGRILHHLSAKCGYSLGLESSGDGTYNVIAGVSYGQDDEHAFQRYLRSKETIHVATWSHLAISYYQTFAVKLDGTQYMRCGSNPMLNIAEDLTVEIFLLLDDLSSDHGVLGKGRMSDEGMGIPYQVRICKDGRVQLLFEDSLRRLRTFSSTGTVEAGKFHRIAVTRKAGSKQSETKGTEKIKITDQDGKPKEISIDSIFSVDVDKFFDIQFFIDGELSGTSRYEDNAPLGHDGDLDIGRCYESPSTFIHTRGTLSEVRIWNTARDSTAVGKRLNGNEVGLVGWWTMEDQTGNVVTDKKNSNNGKMEGGKWVRTPDRQSNTFTLLMNGLPMTVNDVLDDDPLSSTGWGDIGSFLAGFKQDGKETEKFYGMLEEVRIWKTVRTEEEILDNLFCRLKGEKKDLISYYTFDSNSHGENIDSLTDNGLRGNHLILDDDPKRRPRSMLSDAPISKETAYIQSALANVKTPFHAQGDSTPFAAEYGDLQRDFAGNTGGVLKRCYTFLRDGHWVLVTGYKVGNIVSEWVGQAQFNPQVVGFVEGAPPVPSENLTKGVTSSVGNAGKINIVEADSVSFTVGSSKEGSSDIGFASGVGKGFGINTMLISAPLGFGVAKDLTDIHTNINQKGKFKVSHGWSQDESLGQGMNKTQAMSVSTAGEFESNDPKHQVNPFLGSRAVLKNSGFALVQSSTADIYALRLAHNNALISYRMMPNPDVPKDWNIIPFPINPHYSKQGTLDGKIGYKEDGSAAMDSDYSFAKSQGEYSYFKPSEAYAIERRIRRDQERNRSFYADHQTGFGNHPGKAVGMAAAAGASMLVPFAGAALAGASQAVGLATVSKAHEDNQLSNSFAKRDLSNTYVWTAEGGFFAESTETSDVRTETSAGRFGFTGSISAGGTTKANIFGIGLNLEFEASAASSMSVTKRRTKESKETFKLDVQLDVPRNCVRHQRNSELEWKPVFDENGKPVIIPGKVDAYRFKTFYLDCSSRNFEDLYGKVIDPKWLETSNHPNAVALRQTNQSDTKPPCWRVFHRVTFVSRLLPEKLSDSAAPLEKAMKAENVESNWQLVQKLEPFVRNKTNDSEDFNRAVLDALKKYLPELSAHSEDVIEYLRLYYGMLD